MSAHPNGAHRPLAAGTKPVPAPADGAPDTAWRLLYQELFDFAPEANLLTDLSGVIHSVNHAAIEILHTRKEFVLGKPLSSFIAQCDWPMYYNWLVHVRGGETDAPSDRILRVRPARGEIRVMVAQITPFTDGSSSGRLLRWQLRPVSDREELQHRLRHERHFIDSVLQTAQALVLVLDDNGRVQRANAALSSLLQASSDALQGRDWRSFFDQRHHQSLRQAMILALSKDHRLPQRLVVPLALPDGRERTIAWGLQSLALDWSSPIVLLAVGHDITELQEAQRQALQAERLAAIGQVTAALAHEARNLLQRIQGGLDRLSWRLQDRPEALDILTRVQAAQRDMTHLFDNVRSYAAPLNLDAAFCNVADIWREAWGQVLATVPGKQAELLERIEGVGTRCTVDGFRLEQVFRNILENALAAADPARVTVTCRAAQIDQRPAICVSIRDNGPGLSPEQRAQIFEPFYTTKPRGTGLGMAIAKRIVEAHGGTIAVGSEPAGAEILVTLPRSPIR
jgi:PAS domain S-box-containing protein